MSTDLKKLELTREVKLLAKGICKVQATRLRVPYAPLTEAIKKAKSCDNYDNAVKLLANLHKLAKKSDLCVDVTNATTNLINKFELGKTKNDSSASKEVASGEDSGGNKDNTAKNSGKKSTK